MDYTKVLDELGQADLFELYRLHVAIGNELDNPKRILAIKQKLIIGAQISYFYNVDNRLVKSTLLECRQKNVVVLDHEQNKQLLIPYYMLNVDSVETDIYENNPTESLTANNLKVGDIVGFSKEGEDIVGKIKRLNHKTVTLVTNDRLQWRVAYSHLYRVHDAEVEHERQPATDDQKWLKS